MTSAPVSDSPRTMGRGSGTVYVTIGDGQPTLPGTDRSCSFSVESMEALARGVPKDTGSLRPSGVCSSWRARSWGWGTPYRSYCWSYSTMRSPAPMSRDMGASAFMFAVPSWIGPSVA